MNNKIIFLFVTLCLTQTVLSQSVLRQLTESAAMDWQRLAIVTTGKGADGASNPSRSDRMEILDSAKQDALRKLYMAVQGLALDSQRKIQNAVSENDISPLVLRNVVEYYVLMDTRSMSDMSVEVDIEFSVKNQLLALLLPKTMGNGIFSLTAQPHCPTCLDPWPENREVPDDTELIIPSEGYVTRRGRPFSGLIIDARGIDVNPALMPRILNTHEQEIYGTGFADRSQALEAGLVTYADNLADAIHEQRTGSEPFVVRALAASGPLQADLVISDTDALMIHAAAKRNNFLKDCRVIIVVG